MGRITTLINQIGEYSAILKNEEGGGKICWSTKMIYSFLRYGARPVDYWRFQFWRKSSSECDKYLTSMRYSKLYKKLRKLTEDKFYSEGKVYEYNLLKDYIKRDWMVVDKNTSKESIMDFLNKHHSAMAKPNKGEQGHGIFKVSYSDEESINRLESERKKETFILEELLTNIPFLSEINSSSLNTIRCFTYIDKNGKLSILEVILRIGLAGMQVDNWGSGGISYYFDVQRGICKLGIDKQNNVFYYHPSSEYKMIGFELPDYQKLLKFIYELASIEPKARFVGWDVALTPNGYDVIEMNCPGGHDILQAGGSAWGSFIKEYW